LFADPDQEYGFDKALEELKTSLYIENDRAAYHMMLGGLSEMLGDADRAKDDYRTAISVEPNLAGPRSNLAARLDNDVARLRQQLQQSQQSGGMMAGQLKQLMAQMQQIGLEAAKLRFEEHALLAKDIQRSEGLPGTHGLHFRYAMSCYLQQKFPAAETHLLEAYRQQPEIPRYIMGLATYYVQFGNPQEALIYIRLLLEIDSTNQGYRALFSKAKSMLDAQQESTEDAKSGGTTPADPSNNLDDVEN
jgi:tetratricopeptide (TPR) repeat protein